MIIYITVTPRSPSQYWIVQDAVQTHRKQQFQARRAYGLKGQDRRSGNRGTEW